VTEIIQTQEQQSNSMVCDDSWLKSMNKLSTLSLRILHKPVL